MAVDELGAAEFQACGFAHDGLRGCSNLHDDVGSVLGELDPLVSWLQAEVLSRLSGLDTKVDRLQHMLQALDSRAILPSLATACCSTACDRRDSRRQTRCSSQEFSRNGNGSLAPSPWIPLRSTKQQRTLEQRQDSKKCSDPCCRAPERLPTPRAPTTAPPPVNVCDADNGLLSTPPASAAEALNTPSKYKLAKTRTETLSTSAAFETETDSRASSSDVAAAAAMLAGGRKHMASDKRSEGSCQVLEDRALARPESVVLVWNFLSNPESSRVAAWYAVAMPALTLISIVTTLLQTSEPQLLHGVVPAVLETAFGSVFGIELVLRFITCPNRHGFLAGLHNAIDLRAAVGFALPDGDVEGWRGAARDGLLCVVPILRLLKTLRRFERFRLVLVAMEQAFEALPILMFSLLELTLFFSALIFLVEPRDNISSLPRAIWLTIVTMTIVGYGDVVPSSTPGSVIVSFLVIVSVLYMAMPLGIVGQAFVQVWSDRDRILLLDRTQERLRNWGYSAKDVLQIFYWFDEDGSGSLEIDEFQAMVEMMRLGLNKPRIHQLFNAIDADGGGTIDAPEFVKYLYPEEFHRIFGTVPVEVEDEDEDEEEAASGKDLPAGPGSRSPKTNLTVSPPSQDCW